MRFYFGKKKKKKQKMKRLGNENNELVFFLIFEYKECKNVISQILGEENVTMDKDCTNKCCREIRSDEDGEDTN